MKCKDRNCPDCYPERWEEEDLPEPWYWPWLLALIAAGIGAVAVIASGAPRP